MLRKNRITCIAMVSLLIATRQLTQPQGFDLVCLISKRFCTSALYITGDKATDTYSVLTPHLDFDERFKDIESLKKNVDHRGMKLDVEKLKNVWDFMNVVKSNKTRLEERKVEIANKMRLLKTAPGDKNITEWGQKLRIEGKIIRDDLKTIVKTLWELEGNAVIKALSLPNVLHPYTPIEKEMVIHEFGTKPVTSSESHLKKGVLMNIIKYSNQLNYFLLGDAACFELGALHYFSKELEKGGFLHFSNADFVRSVIVEGIGVKYKDPMSSIILKSDGDVPSVDDRTHLVGGASLASFCAFHAKQVVHPRSLPLRYYTLGRQYIPKPRHPDEMGLLNVWQASAVEIFISTSDAFNDMMEEFDSLLKKLVSCYECLGLHFRVVYLVANALNPWESLRASIQMFSAHSDSYVEVGHISLCNDYISKRLLISFQEDDKTESRFVNIVSATAVSVPKLLACVLEQNQDSVLFIPEPIKQHMFNGM